MKWKLGVYVRLIAIFVYSPSTFITCCLIISLLSYFSVVINLMTEASFLQTFSSKFHEHFVDTLSWVTSLNYDVVHALSQRCTDGTFSPAVVRHLLGILQYRSVSCNTSFHVAVEAFAVSCSNIEW